MSVVSRETFYAKVQEIGANLEGELKARGENLGHVAAKLEDAMKKCGQSVSGDDGLDFSGRTQKIHPV